ncbi:stage V sporulation protein E [Thalassobacillus devorans]|uniref:Probable peptidoglycan glycosyltransferase FtsW n=1 Tax=Thalassobacillus devorans TaxID=279813 RepID=A0ABQ1PQV8_9BACI|nr:putative lipid II flippase FtsW [Thalassobacillus devorans]NIK30592.1 cell division protein FtsW [Thalassobacillus devorans]GGD01694.1 stage V sporulation protein E [Thalassobacillus devorans]
MKQILRSYDFGLLAIILLLSIFGLLMVYSSSFAFAEIKHGNPQYFFTKQLMWLIIGLTLFFFVSIFPYQLYGRWIIPIVFLTFLLLIAVLIPGVGIERNYSQRWLGAGPLIFQPSELAKIAFIVYFSKVYTNKQKDIESFTKGVLPPLIILGAGFGLILIQPDLGTGTSILLACGMILSVSGIRQVHFWSLAGTAAAGVAVLAFSASYRLERLTSFVNPFADPDGSGFQLVNSYLSIGTGGVTGTGLANSVQKLGYLPEAHTDFIMAIVAEELGFLGVAMTMILYLLLLFKGFHIFQKTENPFGRLLALGFTFQIISQAMINLGAVTGMLPITGITLPLISYGGTSMVITFISLGIMMNISLQQNYRLKYKKAGNTTPPNRVKGEKTYHSPVWNG